MSVSHTVCLTVSFTVSFTVCLTVPPFASTGSSNESLIALIATQSGGSCLRSCRCLPCTVIRAAPAAYSSKCQHRGNNSCYIFFACQNHTRGTGKDTVAQTRPQRQPRPQPQTQPHTGTSRPQPQPQPRPQEHHSHSHSHSHSHNHSNTIPTTTTTKSTNTTPT